MSNSDFFAASTPLATLPVAHTRQSPPRDRRLLTVSVVALLVLLAAVALAVRHRQAPFDGRPVVLPATLDGLRPAQGAAQFGSDAGWRSMMTQGFGARPFDGRQYGSVAEGRVLNLTVVRGTSDRYGDIHLAAPPFTDYGDVRCTHSLMLGKDAATTSARMLVCARTRDTLSVSVFMLTGGDGYEARAASLVDEVWAANS